MYSYCALGGTIALEYHTLLAPSSTDIWYSVPDTEVPDGSTAFCNPGVDVAASGVWQKRLRRDEPTATCEADESLLSDEDTGGSASIDAMQCHSHNLDLENSLLNATSSSATAATDSAMVQEAVATEDVGECESVLGPAWGHLNADVLHNVFRKLPCQDAITASGVCKQWRAVALQVISSLSCAVFLPYVLGVCWMYLRCSVVMCTEQH